MADRNLCAVSMPRAAASQQEAGPAQRWSGVDAASGSEPTGGVSGPEGAGEAKRSPVPTTQKEPSPDHSAPRWDDHHGAVCLVVNRHADSVELAEGLGSQHMGGVAGGHHVTLM